MVENVEKIQSYRDTSGYGDFEKHQDGKIKDV